jgi:hypothetical protein
MGRAAFEARAANMGPARRIVVWNHPPDRQPGMQESGSSIMDALRKAVASRRFTPISGDSTLAVLRRTRNRDSVMKMLGADIMVSIRGTLIRPDSVYWVMNVFDPSAYSPFAVHTVVSPRAPLATPLVYEDSLVAQTIRALEEMDGAPRRRGNDSGAFGPPGAPPTLAALAQPAQPVKEP